jgi:hypothetical protein
MTVTATKTVREIALAALKKIGVVAHDLPSLDAYQGETARIALDMMLKGWQNVGFKVFTQAAQSVTLTTAASYTLAPVRPLSIESVRLKSNGSEMPMEPMMRRDYDELPVKATTGTPTQFYYDRQREDALLYVWPVLPAANGETLEITYQREVEDITSVNDAVDMPVEWYETIVYNLAARCADDFALMGPDIDRVIARAEYLLSEARGFDVEGSVWFGGSEYA